MKRWGVVGKRILGLAIFVFSLAQTAYAGERTLQLRTTEDPDVIVEDAVCDEAGFTSNVRLGAAAWTYQARASDGEVLNDDIRQVGTAKACVRITDFRFPPDSLHPFYVRFDLKEESYTAVGQCMVTSNNVPTPGLILAGCNLHLIQGPAGILGGSLISSSVFNPFRLPGFGTGSYWTLRLHGVD
ncbi:MAG TPA: hypothetical protein VIK48_06040 [Candidatus Manganitrophaceae bacterium]